MWQGKQCVSIDRGSVHKQRKSVDSRGKKLQLFSTGYLPATVSVASEKKIRLFLDTGLLLANSHCNGLERDR